MRAIINAIKDTATDITNTMAVINLGIERGWITDIAALQVALSEIGLIIEAQIFPVIDTQQKNS